MNLKEEMVRITQARSGCWDGNNDEHGDEPTIQMKSVVRVSEV
jgi:hypothetical protein